MTANTSSKRNKRSTAIRLSLAGLALVGIGAATTTAAWTDNVIFNATATTSSFNLVGSANGIDFQEGNGVAPSVSVPIDAAVFQNITPGDTKKTTITVKNVGALSAVLDVPTVAGSGDLFATGGLSVSIARTGTTGVLATNGTATFDVTVTAPTSLASGFQSKSGIVTATISGKSS